MGEVVDAEHVDELVEVGLDDAGPGLGGLEHDGQARDAGLVGAADGERVDVEVAAAEERGDAVKHAGHVFHIGDEGMFGHDG